jgi:hypothetical protein
MKKIAAFGLLFVAAAFAAQAYMTPLPYRYRCDYNFPIQGATDPGYSYFTLKGTANLMTGTENYSANTSTGWDNRKIAFAKPVNHQIPNPNGPGFIVDGTTYEFTINPVGPQCTDTFVTNNGLTIYFDSCSDGHRRTCWVQ